MGSTLSPLFATYGYVRKSLFLTIASNTTSSYRRGIHMVGCFEGLKEKLDSFFTYQNSCLQISFKNQPLEIQGTLETPSSIVVFFF